MAEISGQIIAVLPTRSGTSAKGTAWSSQTAVIETREQYPKKVAFDVFGADRIAQFNIKCGETITVQFDIDARQYQDRWFNSIKAWNIIRPGQQDPVQGGYNFGNPQTVAQAAQAAQQAAMSGASGQTNSSNLLPPKQPAQPQGDSSDLPF